MESDSLRKRDFSPKLYDRGNTLVFGVLTCMFLVGGIFSFYYVRWNGELIFAIVICFIGFAGCGANAVRWAWEPRPVRTVIGKHSVLLRGSHGQRRVLLRDIVEVSENFDRDGLILRLALGKRVDIHGFDTSDLGGFQRALEEAVARVRGVGS